MGRINRLNKTQLVTIAAAAHECNRIWSRHHGDESHAHYEDAPEWQRTSAIDGIKAAINGATPEEQHQAWYDSKARDGWVYGAVKDADAKTHPCMVNYADLPSEQRAKDAIYLAVVRSFVDAMTV